MQSAHIIKHRRSTSV